MPAEPARRASWVVAAVGIGTTLLASACAPQPAPPVPPPIVRLRGHAAIGPGGPLFLACGAQVWRPLDDRSGELVPILTRLGAAPGEPIYVELRGQSAEPPAPPGAAGHGAIALEVRRAERGGFACFQDLMGVEVRAFGEEPFWRLDVTPRGIVFFDRTVTLVFPYVASRAESGAELYDSSYVGWEPHHLALEVREQRCVDPTSGGYFALAARLEMDGRAFEGCAAEGWH
jgi:uncharacterized membrane protein